MRAFYCIALAGCVAPGDSRITVAEQSSLGIVALELERTDISFELRALDADDQIVATVHERVGTVEDLAKYGEGDYGTELVFSARGHDERVITSEIQRHSLSGLRDPSVRELLSVPTVASVLEREANISIHLPPVGAPPPESAYAYGSCPADYMLTSPLAQQCCHYWDADWYTWEFELFVRDDGSVVERERNPSGVGCTNSGGGSCSGASCYYGPNAHARSNIYSPVGTAFIYPVGYRTNGSSYCTYDWSGAQPRFATTHGTFPTGQGCPGGDDGAGGWDY